MITKIYEHLRAHGAVSSASEFSRNYLGRERTYMNTVTHQGFNPSAGVVAYLAATLRTRGHTDLADRATAWLLTPRERHERRVVESDRARGSTGHSCGPVESVDRSE